MAIIFLLENVIVCSANIGDLVPSVLVLILNFVFAFALQITFTAHSVSHKSNTDCSNLKKIFLKKIKEKEMPVQG